MYDVLAHFWAIGIMFIIGLVIAFLYTAITGDDSWMNDPFAEPTAIVSPTPTPKPEDAVSEEMVPGVYRDEAGNYWVNIVIETDDGTTVVPRQVALRQEENRWYFCPVLTPN